MKVAFIGLGNMGSGMASNIQKNDFELTVWNRTPSKMDPFIKQGASGASTPREAAETADVIVTSVMDDQTILDVLEGDNGILAGMKPSAVHVCVTTISPQFAGELAQKHKDHGSKFVMAPVLGRPDAALDGSLIALVAGEEEAIKIAEPVIDAYTTMQNCVGDKAGDAATLKLCLNYAVISSIELMGEIYALVDKAGLSMDKIEGFFKLVYGFPVLQMYAEKIKNRQFDDGGFRMTGGIKDVRLMIDAAKSLGTTLDIGEIIENKMQQALDSGMEDLDWSATYEITRKRAGLS